MPQLDDNMLSIRDILDSQLETKDKRRIGRVADIEAELREDGTLVLKGVISGPQALAGRLSTPLRIFFQRLFHDRFDHCIPMQDIENFGPTLKLHHRAAVYPVGQSDRWIARYLLRWLPGSGYR
ncbi:MAG TPA: hypothetical protein VFA41_04960 [Ktedonobacteraceae bacterium]|jgi:hypothetical protein|nr:hypothetical protein [Ktedonobacteraceae bacterium]